MVQSIKNNLKNKSKKHSWHLGFHWHLGFPFKTAAVGIPVWKSSFLWILERSLSKIQGDACNHVIQHYRSFCFGFLDNIQDQKHSNDRSCESAADEKATTVLVVFTLTSESMLVMFQVVFPKISRKFGQSESVFLSLSLSLSLSRLPMLLRNCDHRFESEPKPQERWNPSGNSSVPHLETQMRDTLRVGAFSLLWLNQAPRATSGQAHPSLRGSALPSPGNATFGSRAVGPTSRRLEAPSHLGFPVHMTIAR